MLFLLKEVEGKWTLWNNTVVKDIGLVVVSPREVVLKGTYIENVVEVVKVRRNTTGDLLVWVESDFTKEEIEGLGEIFVELDRGEEDLGVLEESEGEEEGFDCMRVVHLRRDDYV